MTSYPLKSLDSNPLRGKRRVGFEVWIFKQIAPRSFVRGRDAGPRSFTVIAGFSRSEEGEYAFIRTIDGMTGTIRFYPFPISAYSATEHPLSVAIGANHFSLDGMTLALADGNSRIDASIGYTQSPATPFGRKPPNMMGPLAFLPFMSSRFAVLGLDLEAAGSATFSDSPFAVEDKRISFDGGRAYVEKMWGKQLPEAWIRLQANYFDTKGAALSLSIVRIRRAGRPFIPFTCALRAKGVQYQFANYTRARLDLLESGKNSLRLLLSDSSYKLEILVRRDREGALFDPTDEYIGRRVAECEDARLRVLVKRRHGSADNLIFDETSPAAGARFVGDPTFMNG